MIRLRIQSIEPVRTAQKILFKDEEDIKIRAIGANRDDLDRIDIIDDMVEIRIILEDSVEKILDLDGIKKPVVVLVRFSDLRL